VGLNFIDTSEQVALFGEVSHRFFHDQLKWTLGLRTFRDENTTESFFLDPGTVYTATYEATTPRAVLTWTPNTDLSVYGSYSQGFRSGVLQNENITSLGLPFPPVQPDTLNNYEMGAKGSFLDRRISFEAAVFYIDWQDVQQVLNIAVGFLPDGRPIGQNVAINGDSASGLGADFALTVRPTESLELGASLSWNDLTMDKSVFALDFGGNLQEVFAPGDRLGFSPEYTASLFGDYAFPVGGSLEGRFSGSINHTTSQDSFGGTTRLFGQDITIARASFSLEGEHWTAMLYGDNLNNENDTVVPQFSPQGSESDARVRPRTVGVQLEFHY
jgi:outer membrane receptor protein involved in Fe transport